MTTRKDALMVQAVLAFAQGCGGVSVSEEAGTWFHERYYDWIDTPKKNPAANGQTPLQVWDKVGDDFVNHFRTIGSRAAQGGGGGTVEKDALMKGALSLEQELDCPWCPIRE